MPRLSIELVPKTCWLGNVRSAVSTAAWDVIRKQVYKIAHRKCEICCGRGRQHPVEAHEVWNYNDQTHVQTLVRLMALCPSCHQVKHFGLAEVNGNFEEARRHLMKVNQWTKQEMADAYITQAFKTWDERSNHVWTLDISYLAQFGVDLSAIKPSERAHKPKPKIPEVTAGFDRGFDPFDHIVSNERAA